MAGTQQVNERLIVLSGCSAGGKSTLLAEMARRGTRVCMEPGRRVVEQQQAISGDGLPWVNAEKFLHLCIELAVEDHAMACASAEVTLFDRSLVDAVAGLVRMAEQNNTPTLARPFLPLLEVHRYAMQVLLAPPWPELFLGGADDAQRKHSFDDAQTEFDHLHAFYPECDYTVAELPRGTVAERADFLSTVIAAVG